MKLSKKIIALTTLMAMLASSTNLSAEEFCCQSGGCAYDEGVRCSSLAPAIALGTIALIAIIAVAVQNTSGHSHCHTHN